MCFQESQKVIFLFDTTDAAEISKYCRNLGAGAVVVKLGEKGAYYENKDQNGFVGAYSVPYVMDLLVQEMVLQQDCYQDYWMS